MPCLAPRPRSAFQEALGSATAAEAMKFDGVRPETLVILTEG
jgi:hypothetical protein